MLKQVFHDAKMYKDQGVLTDTDISMLRALRSQHDALHRVDLSKQF